MLTRWTTLVTFHIGAHTKLWSMYSQFFGGWCIVISCSVPSFNCSVMINRPLLLLQAKAWIPESDGSSLFEIVIQRALFSWNHEIRHEFSEEIRQESCAGFRGVEFQCHYICWNHHGQQSFDGYTWVQFWYVSVLVLTWGFIYHICYSHLWLYLWLYNGNNHVLYLVMHLSDNELNIVVNSYFSFNNKSMLFFWTKQWWWWFWFILDCRIHVHFP